MEGKRQERCLACEAGCAKSCTPLEVESAWFEATPAEQARRAAVASARLRRAPATAADIDTTHLGVDEPVTIPDDNNHAA